MVHLTQRSPFSLDLTVATTLCPSLQKILQASRPIPELPPVIKINFLMIGRVSSDIMYNLFLFSYTVHDLCVQPTDIF